MSKQLAPRFTFEEQARQDFVSGLRANVLGEQAGHMRRRYEQDVLPAFERNHGRRPKDSGEVRREMIGTREFRFYSALRTCAQEMVHGAVIPAVERERERISAQAASVAGSADVGGSLRLDPGLPMPRYMTEVDIHLAPGGYHADYGDNDIAAGLQYDRATRVFAFRQFGADLDDIGHTMANYVRLRYPELRPQSILDCGCTIGHNTLPWAQTFADAEVHAVDIGPGLLRYAHARAQGMGLPIHFHQMDATSMKFADESFDVVFSSMFLHELPVRAIKAFFREAHRVLKPGGLLWNMELPPNASLDPYQGFTFDWDTYYNNEPSMKTFRDQNYRDLCAAGGFRVEDFVDSTLPRYTFVGEDAFVAALHAPTRFDIHTGRMNAGETRWYGFGAFKQ